MADDPNVGVTAVSYQFLPWVRRGLAAALSAPDDMSALPSRAIANIGVQLAAPWQAESFAPIQVRLHGPGDVIGIDTGLVVRTDPKPNSHNFEPNYLALIDFDPPDFPWILTPAKNNDMDRLRPWLVLLVFRVAKTGLPRMQPQALMPSIRIKAADVADELPDLVDSWSWAHAQVVSKANSNALLQNDLQSQPASNVSRLVCPRRLHENTNYVACVVPAFEPGRLRGLGLASDDNPAMQTIAPAWDKHVAADVTLPVYYSWEFSTSAAGDFESLARRLKTPSRYTQEIRDKLAQVGTSPMSVDPLLSGLDPVVNETMEGALVPIKYTEGGRPANDVQAESLMAIVNTPQDQVVNPVGDDGLNAEHERLQVKPQMQGGWHIKKHQVQMAELQQHWLADLNLNPRYRGAAGYGAEVVRKNQEHYVDAAWDQIGRIQEAERRANMTRLAIEAQMAIQRKHFAVLPPERLLQVMGPALSRVESLGIDNVAYRIGGQLGSLGGQIERSSLPSALADTGMRRLASPQRRTLRMAARLNGSVERLAGVTQAYIGVMAAATQRSAAFKVNDFLPDGLISSKALGKIDLAQAENTVPDLGELGLGKSATIGQLRQVVSGGAAALKQVQTSGVPALPVRDGQKLGVLTDMHVDRFGELAAKAPGIKGSDWRVVSRTVELLGKRGVEGLLIESNAQTAGLQFSTMRLDARNGELRLDKAVVRFDAARKALTAPAGKRAAALGINLGQINIPAARRYSNTGLFAALPPNALSSAVNVPAPKLVLTPGFEFGGVGAGREPSLDISITLPPAVRTREVLNRFTVATRGTQALWTDAFQLSHVETKPVDFALARAASTLIARTDPRTTLMARMQSMVSIAGSPASSSNAFIGHYLAADATIKQQRFLMPRLFDRVMACPELREPLYKALADYDKYAFMPGVDDIPQDTIMLVKVNQYFVDSFMVGANQEMNRELLWRGFPCDLRGTPFQRFWGREAIVPLPPPLPEVRVPLNDIQPIHQWLAQPLGRRTDLEGGSTDRIALLVRGQLLRRYPNTAVYAWRKAVPPNPPEKTQLAKKPDGSAADNAILTPAFSGVIEPDITFFGFDIKESELEQWCFVLEEHMSEPRFGFDVGDKVPGQAVAAVGGAAGSGFGAQRRPALSQYMKDLEALQVSDPAAFAKTNPYKALSWDSVAVAEGAYATLASLMNLVEKPFVNFPALQSDASSADIAKALLQFPFRAYYVGKDLVT